MVTTKDKLEFVYLMAKHSNATLSTLQRIMRHGASLKGLAEEHCKGNCANAGHRIDQGGMCVRQSQHEQAIDDLCSSFRGQGIFQHDPRGATVKIKVPDGFTNDWGNVGICVPTS